jgi:hypothetical protein
MRKQHKTLFRSQWQAYRGGDGHMGDEGPPLGERHTKSGFKLLYFTLLYMLLSTRSGNPIPTPQPNCDKHLQ